MTGAGDAGGELVRAGRRLAAAGLVVGSGGNVSVRLPDGERCLVTAAGTWFDDLSAIDDVAVVDLETGAAVDIDRAPSTELAVHLASYRARADVGAVVHVHPQHVLLLDALGHDVSLTTFDHAHYVGAVARLPQLSSGTRELADAVAARLADGIDSVVLARHGVVVVAGSLDLAVRRCLNLEEAAVATYRGLLLGGPPDPVTAG